MNFKRLEVLLAISQSNNISRAAKQLDIKQPTVTFHMKSLEKEFGTTLFRTHGSHTSLTEAGRALLFYAKKIMYLSNDAQRTMHTFFDPSHFHLRIGASTVPSTYLLPNIIGTFKDTYEKLKVTITVMPAPIIQDMICEYKLNLGVVSSSDTLLDKVHSKMLCTDEMVLIYSKDHPFSKLDKITADDMKDERFILHGANSTTRKLADTWAEHMGVRLQPFVEISSPEAIKRSVLSNIGVSILSKLSVKDEIERGELLYSQLPEYSPSRNIYLIYNKDPYMPAIIRDFIDLLMERDY